MHMIQKMAWNTFKNTGDIQTFLELKQVENIEFHLNGENNESSKNEGDYTHRK